MSVTLLSQLCLSRKVVRAMSGDRGPSHEGPLPGRLGLLVSESGLGNHCRQHD